MRFLIKLLSSALLFFGSVAFAAALAKKSEKARRFADELYADVSELSDGVKTLGLPIREAVASLSSPGAFFADVAKEASKGRDIAFSARSAASRAEKDGLMNEKTRLATEDLFLRLGEGSAENQEKLINEYLDRLQTIRDELSETSAKTKKLFLALGAAAGATAAIMTV